MVTATEALDCLREGNLRFVANRLEANRLSCPVRREELAAGQNPSAIILGCSDSRVPAEIVFDQGVGELFVVRVAGNVVAPSQVGSVEFAAEQFGTPLVVVLGHTGCGAVKTALDQLNFAEKNRSPNLHDIVSRIQPAIAPLLNEDFARDRDKLIQAAVRANIQASVDHLKHGSQILEKLVAEKGLLIVGAEYSLETGVVEFLN